MTQTAEKTCAETERKSGVASPWILTAGCMAIFAAVSACVFRGAWNPLNTIDGADASLWVPAFVQHWTKGLFVPRWFPHFLAGIGQQFQFLSHGLLLMLTLPPYRFHGFEFMLDAFLAGAFMFAFLRDQRVGGFGALVGGLSFQLGNGLITSARQGALWKFDTVCWAPLFLLFFSRILDDDPRRFKNSLFAGATLGLQFLGGEIQLAYYVCLLALAYFVTDAVEKLWTAGKAHDLSDQLKPAAKRLLWAGTAAVIGIIFAAEVFYSYFSYTRNNSNVGVRTDGENWRFATEFSFPPQETLSLGLTGGIFGNDHYFQNSIGQQIARITDDYLGIVVLMFAFVALFSDKKRRYFFACAAVAALIISFGRYFPPPYRLIHSLPMMKGLRNPHKWLFITSLCVSILAGMGADYWKNAPILRNRKIFGAIVAFVVFMVGIAFVTKLTLSKGNLWPVALPIAVLVVASLVGITVRIHKVSDSVFGRLVIPAIIVALLAGDLIFNASKFILYYNYQERYVENVLGKWLTSKAAPFRVKLWSESPYLKYTVTQVLPYYGVDVTDAIMSRRPPRYSEIFEAARGGQLSYGRLFQLFNVKYILSSTAIQGTDIPMRLAIILESNSESASPDDCYIYEFKDFLPRVYMVNRFEVAEPDKVIEALNRPDFDLRHSVILDKQASYNMGESLDRNAGELEWSMKDFSQSPHRVSMNISTNRPAILVLLDFIDENWHAYVDKKEVEILTADYLMRAVVIPEGTHEVIFAYKPPIGGFALTLTGWIVLVSVIMIEGVRIMLRARTERGIEKIR